MTPDSQLADYPFITDFDPFDFFQGQLYAYGAFIDRTGAVKRRFTADITGHIEQDILILDEHFILPMLITLNCCGVVTQKKNE